MAKKKRKITTIYMSPELHARFREYCKKEGYVSSAIIEKLVAKWLEKEEKKEVSIV